MEDLIYYMKQFSKKGSPHATFNGIFNQELQKQQKSKRKNYFAVKDICDPLQAYFKLKYPDIFKYTIEIQKKLNIGNKQHYIVEKKFEKLEGFVDKELILDGELLGIPLKGRVDAKIKDSLWELKSKATLPKDVDDLIIKYPQDIEQLVFYSILDPTNPKENYLIFTDYFNTNKYKVFQINILDFGKIKNIAMNRIQKLNECLNNQKVEDNQRCRYCYKDCEFKKRNICSSFDNPAMPCGVKEFIEIKECKEFEEKLKNINLVEFHNQSIPVYHLIISRKILHQESEGDLEEYAQDEQKKIDKSFINNLIGKSNYNISYQELSNLQDKQKIKGLSQNKNNFIKCVCNGENKIFPLLIHISDKQDPSYLNQISDYKKSELGIYCLNNNSTKGYIITYFPKQNDEIRVFEQNYEFDKGALEKLKTIVEILKTKDKQKLQELPRCPNFIHGNCKYKKICP